MKHRALLAGLLALVACGTHSKPVTPEPTEATKGLQSRIEQGILPAVQVDGEEPVRSTLAERMAKHKVPGVSIAVFENYEVIWAGAYGVVDVETKAPVTTSTLFQAGSISKSVNALAVLKTAADGAFKLDAPINDYLTSWKLPDNELTARSPVTVRRLLSHMAGTTVHGFPGYPTGAPVPTLVQVLDGTPPANTPAIRVDLAPGSTVRYSGGGTTITQLLLVDMLGKPYPEIQRKLVLDPLGMTSSTYEQPLPPDRVVHAASGHHRDGSVVPTKRHVYPEMAAAGLWTTPTDLATFFIEIQLARTHQSKMVSNAIAMQMTTEADKTAHVGLGVFMSTRNGAAIFGHGGADEGFQANVSASLDRGYGVVVMANSDNGFPLFAEIERTVFAAMQWQGADAPIVRVALTEAQRDRMVGTFSVEGGAPFSISPRDDGLIALQPFADAVPLVPVSTEAVVRLDDGVVVTFIGDDEVRLQRDPDQPFMKATRVPATTRVPLLELAAGRFDDAVAGWKELLRTDPKSPLASEEINNIVGYQMLLDGKVDGSVTVFRAIVAVFPDSSNAYDSLGEALMTKGDKPGAITAYETAIAKLDADTRIPAEEKPLRKKHADEMLAKLRAK